MSATWIAEAITAIDAELQALDVKRAQLVEARTTLQALAGETPAAPAVPSPADQGGRRARPSEEPPADDVAAALLHALRSTTGPQPMAEILRRSKLGHLSGPTIRRRLNALTEAKQIRRHGMGAGTKYSAVA